MSLVAFAEAELRAAGLFDPDSDYGGALAPAVLELVQVFAAQDHSGMSGACVLRYFSRVAAFQPLVPLTGEDAEWMEVGTDLWQNRRCPHVFRNSEGAYDSNGRIFRDPDGATWTSRESRVPVTFPYTPRREYVDRPPAEDAPED